MIIGVIKGVYMVVYKIKNIKNNKVYIGITKDAEARKKKHFSGIRNRSHPNYKIKKDSYIYTENDFTFEIIQNLGNIAYEESCQIETLYIRFLNSVEFGYNIIEETLGNPMLCEEVKNKMTETKQLAVPNIIQCSFNPINHTLTLINSYNSIKETARECNIAFRNLQTAIKNKWLVHEFYYIKENELKSWVPALRYHHPLAEIDEDGKIVVVYFNLEAVASKYNISKKTIPKYYQVGYHLLNPTRKKIKRQLVKITKEEYFNFLPIKIINNL